MPLETRARPLTPELSLPPPFTLVRLRELGDAFAHAHSDRAPSKAPVRWSMSGVSISPNSPWCWSRTSRCAQARRAFYAGMVALADALIAHAATGNRHHHRVAGFDSRSMAAW